MLRFTLRRLAVSPFSLFMVEQKVNPALVGLPISRRGRMLGRLYRGLSPHDRAALEKRAAAHPSFGKSKKRKAAASRGKSQYNKFVRLHFEDKALRNMAPSEKISAIARMWAAQGKRVPRGAAKAQIAKASKRHRSRTASAAKKKSGKTIRPAKVAKRNRPIAKAVKRIKVNKPKAVKRRGAAASATIRKTKQSTRHGARASTSSQEKQRIFILSTANLSRRDIEVLKALLKKSRAQKA